MFDQQVGLGDGHVAWTPSSPEEKTPASTKSEGPRIPTSSAFSSITSRACTQATRGRVFDLDGVEMVYKTTLLPPRLDWLQRLKDRGVTGEALAEPELPATGHVVFYDGGSSMFGFPEHGGQSYEAWLFLARDELGRPSDIVAFEPRRGLKASWLGRVALLGQENLYLAPRFDRERALTVFCDPIEWLIGDRDGVVVIDPVRAAPLLRRTEPLRALSPDFGRQLAQVVNPTKPRIYAPAAGALQ